MQVFFERFMGKFDKMIFYPTILILLCTIGLGLGFPEVFQTVFGPLTNNFIVNFSWFVKLFTFVVLVFLAFVAFSKYGNYRLGKDNETPEYSTFSWASMCFCCGIGYGAFLWFAAIALFHVLESPLIIAAGNQGIAAGFPVALANGYMEMGIPAWAMFTMCGLAVALPAFRQDRPLNLAGGLYGLLGDRAYTSAWGKLADLTGAIASVAGPAAGLGFGIMIISGGIKANTGITVTLHMQIGIVVFFCVAFMASSFIGIDKGMKRLSELCVYTSLCITAFVFITGPTTFLANSITESIGAYINNFVSIIFFADAGNFVPVADEVGKFEYAPRGWHSWWFVFWMVWWVAYAPYSGGFLARISRGRTLRQFICGSILLPSSLVIFVTGIWSSAAAYLQFTGTSDLFTLLKNDLGMVIYEILAHYPFSTLTTGLVVFICAILGITTFDSVTYFISVQSSSGDINPRRSMKLTWGIILGSLSLTFLTLGNFDALKSLGLLSGIPFLFYMCATIVSTYKMLRMIEDKKL